MDKSSIASATGRWAYVQPAINLVAKTETPNFGVWEYKTTSTADRANVF